MSEIIILVCTLGTTPAECNIQTAIEVQKYKSQQLCVYGAVQTLSQDPRGTTNSYPKIICNGR